MSPVVVVEHPREDLALVRTTVLLRRRAEVASLFGNGQLAVVGDAEFDSWDRAEVILVRRADLVDVLPLGIAPSVRRVLYECLVEAVAVDLGNKVEGAVEGLGVRVAGEGRERTIVW